ncbi:MAG: hypothetical protein JW774_11590 [Candidatus Aureabacteria bacterium]|nr:hypothetical protein [Candidatus Auribacterota bacterium]
MKPEIRHFDNLSFSDQCDLIKSSDFADKGDLILRSADPKSIFSDLTCQDFFLIYHESGDEIQPDILKFSSPDQIVFVSDFECWKKDEINQKGFLKWLDMLNQSGHEQIQTWLVSSDHELIVSALQKFVEVVKTEHLELIDDYIGDRPFFTLDNLYYICIEGDNHDAIRQIINHIYEGNRSMYVSLLEALISEDEWEVLEEAYKSRNERLTEFGFPQKEEAMKIYQDIKDFSSLEEKNKKDRSCFSKDIMFSYPVISNVKDLFLDRVLTLHFQKFPKDDSIDWEFACLANKIISCENVDFLHSQTIKQCLNRAKKLVSLSLEDLSHGNMETALDLLSTYWIEDLFRWGVTRIRKLRQFTLDILPKVHLDHLESLLKFLGSPWDVKLKGLFQFCPVKAKENASFEVQEYEDFESLKQVETLYHELIEIQAVLEFFISHLGPKWLHVLEKNLKGLNQIRGEITWMPLMATLCAQLCLKRSFSFDPLNIEDVKHFIKKGFDSQTPFRKLLPEVKTSLIQALDIGVLQEESVLFKILFARMEEELGGLNLRIGLSPSYLPILLLKAS